MKKGKYQSIIDLAKYATLHKKEFLLSVLYGVLNNVFTLFSLLLGAYLTGLAFSGADGNYILGYFPYLLLLIALKGLFAYYHMVVCHELAYLILEDMRRDVYDAILRGSPLSSVKYRTGDVSSIMMEDVESLEAFFAHMLSDYIITFICMLVFLLAFFFMSWKAALLSLVASILIALTPYLFGKRDEKNGRELRRGLGVVNAGVVDTVQGLSEIMIFGREEKFIDKVMTETMKLNRYEIKDGRIKGLQSSLISLLMSIVLIAVILLSHSMVISGEISAPMVAVFITMSLNIFLPVVMVSQTAGKINTVVASAERIQAILNEASPLKPTEEGLKCLETDALIALRDVSFSYDETKPVLRNLNLDIKQGESIALTGESGVGKTTLINLLLRFYDPDQGSLYLKCKNLRSVSAEEVRRDIAYVPQDVYLFHGTVLDNLRLGRPDATMEEVRQAAKIAMADEFIVALDRGYDSFVGERGLTLSGGQKQRLAIARALVMGASILIMDEAVSNLDTESEELFRKALDNIRKEKTIITIAHRLSTIQHADRILYMEEGRVVESGSHEELMSLNGRYRAKFYRKS